MRIDACIAEDKCFQGVGNLGRAAHTFDEVLTNLRNTFERIRMSGLKLTVHKREFGLSELQFLGSSIRIQGMSPNCEKVGERSQIAENTEANSRFIGFFQYLRAILPKLWKIALFLHTFAE